VNGRADHHVAALDRGLSYGDGVFRTLAIADGRPRWWDAQLEKLSRDCSRLGMACPEAEVWLGDLSSLALPRQGLLRLTVTRGEGPRGYAPPEPASLTRIVSAWQSPPPDVPQAGITARVCQLRLGHQPLLAGLKHLNRLENVLARAEWRDPSVHEGILLDEEGRVISGVMSNLFIWRGGVLATPRLDRCGVAGMARQRLMERAIQAGYTVEEADLSLDDVLAADEVMLTNSLILLWRVARLDNRVWPGPVVSPALRGLLHG
jgi:4-amino-4-deoxychorismate lyase